MSLKNVHIIAGDVADYSTLEVSPHVAHFGSTPGPGPRADDMGFEAGSEASRGRHWWEAGLSDPQRCQHEYQYRLQRF